MKIISAARVINGETVREQFFLEERICKICKKRFQPQKRKSFYCSRKCGKRADYEKHSAERKANSKKWYSENKDAAKERRKKYYWSDPERFRKDAIEYKKKNQERYKELSKKNKDKTRHGGEREKLILKNGLVCSKCGKNGSRNEIAAHHTSFNKTDHENQILLCRSCHAKEHGLGKSNESIEAICHQCSSKFTAKSKRFKYCSTKCKRRAEYLRDMDKIKARALKWKLDNPERLKKNKHQHYIDNAEKYKERSRINRLKRKTGE